MNKKIAILPGDGIGPEVIKIAVSVLESIAKKYKHQFVFKRGLIGGVAIDQTGNPLPDSSIKLCLDSDAVLFGAIGDPKYDDPKLVVRPEQGLLKLRKSLGLYANIRPIKSYPFLYHKSPLKTVVIRNTDFVFIRELTGGIYFGEKGRKDNGKTAFDTNIYTKKEIERVAFFAFNLARIRKKKVTLIDKANVLETSRLWREVVVKIAKKYPEIELQLMLVDNAAMQIIKNPSQFDVILTENMFGDILSDEASVIAGSLGVIPSVSIGENTSLFEPIHGSYPKAKGKNTANPTATILSAALLLRMAFQLEKEAQAIENAVFTAIENGQGTIDLFPDKPLSTTEFGKAVISRIAATIPLQERNLGQLTNKL